jgi:hypothetical protein
MVVTENSRCSLTLHNPIRISIYDENYLGEGVGKTSVNYLILENLISQTSQQLCRLTAISISE